MRKFLYAFVLVMSALAAPVLAGDPNHPGLEPPPPCETCVGGETAQASGVCWIWTAEVRDWRVM